VTTSGGKITKENVDPHHVGQLLASLRGNKAQRERILKDLTIMRKRANWTDLDWRTVLSLHSQLDTITAQIEHLRESIKEAGVEID